MVHRPNVNAELCFVLMPFSAAFHEYYTDIIRPAVEQVHLRAVRADELYGPKPIIADIWASIWRARVIIADVTGRNPNVNYEIGLGDALGVPTVILSQRIDDVPFDYRHRRCVLYDTSGSRWQTKLSDEIIHNLQAVLDETDYQPPLPWPDEASQDKHMVHTTTVVTGRALMEVLKGVNLAAGLLSTMYGPWGTAVSLRTGSDRNPRPLRRATKVLDSIAGTKPLEMHGVVSTRLIAKRMVDDVGDGSKLATLLLAGFLDGGAPLVLEYPVNRKLVLQHMDSAISTARKAVQGCRLELQSDQEQLVIKSAVVADSELARLLGEATSKVGKYGAVLVEEARGEEIRFEPWQDMRFDRGRLSSDFVTDQQEDHCCLEDCSILLYAGKLEKVDSFIELMKSLRRDERSLLIIALDFSDSAAAALAQAHRYRYRICAVKAPGFGDRQKPIMEDIAIRSGGQVLYPDLAMSAEEADRGLLGNAELVIVEKDRTSLRGLGGSREGIENRIQQLRRQLDRTTSEYDREKLQERLANLTGDALILQIGGASEDETVDRAAIAKSAFAALSHARTSGVVPGGGAALLLAHDRVIVARPDGDLPRRAFQAVARALVNPTLSHVQNRRGGGEELLGFLKGTNEEVRSVIDPIARAEGALLDPWFVVDCAIRTSWAEARLLLDTTCWDVSPGPEQEILRRLR